MKDSFDMYAEKYDTWFLKNKNVLYSELKLVAHFLKNAGDILSVGCGSGLFEMLLKKEFNISVKYGIEPSKSMAEIAEKRGMIVTIETAEEGDFGENQYDTILFNGTTSYLKDLQKAFNKAYKALRKNGRIVVIDVPKESSYAMLYSLAKVLGTWDHPMLEGIQPRDPYPIEFVKAASWRTTAEKTMLLQKEGFSDFAYAQTLTKHPVYSDNELEEPVEGFDCGDYVAICAYKK
ncbi:MAG TPA: class I SAM-dependent methyltransferase [Bacteroidales bacterium]|nr:class I SAM-dependent methyltransferase [Bacteroidales bacterium]HOU96809.1 class I SAM-dependent methyltransferase [Bacteroidales bacterium]HQG37394.1 class I SAM-dependent methyltransferase [Bacteroidales bacterium]HQG52010.1 class I SAM-dependent methyltransferase [Bacteroidales bacterium]HRC89353.1 class I SAM-dependent methyltransferase [Bacteroidales bacterium]